jgi:hypothetical protein
MYNVKPHSKHDKQKVDAVFFFIMNASQTYFSQENNYRQTRTIQVTRFIEWATYFLFLFVIL